MPSVQIQGYECRLERIFSKEFRFTIPLYQRPYSWEKEQAGALIEDLLQAFEESNADPEFPYFMGSLVLIKQPDRPDADVVDGQQRLTTLTMLMSVLAHLAAADISSYIHQHLVCGEYEPFSPPELRLLLRQQDRAFFEQYIQTPGGVALLEGIQAAKLPDSQRCIRDNALLMARTVQEQIADNNRVRDFLKFLLARVSLVVVAAADNHSAYRIFSVLNDRGLDLSDSDILKADLIGQLDAELQGPYAQSWETEEENLGREEMKELFSHIRMMFLKRKYKTSVLREIQTEILAQRYPGQAQVFLDQVVFPGAQAFHQILRQEFSAAGEEHAPHIRSLLTALNRVDNIDWRPPALAFLQTHPHDPEAVLTFLRDLERLAASLFIRKENVNRRIQRYGLLLSALEAQYPLEAPDSPLQLSAAERQATLEALDSAGFYQLSKVPSYVLLRLDEALSPSGLATYTHPKITVEHVLPQTPPPGSQWRQWFTDEQREAWVHRLGNLVLLSKSKNSRAQNYEFEKKKTTYFTGRGGVSPFVLTTQVLATEQWTPTVLEQRQRDCLKTLQQLWRL